MTKIQLMTMQMIQRMPRMLKIQRTRVNILANSAPPPSRVEEISKYPKESKKKGFLLFLALKNAENKKKVGKEIRNFTPGR